MTRPMVSYGCSVYLTYEDRVRSHGVGTPARPDMDRILAQALGGAVPPLLQQMLDAIYRVLPVCGARHPQARHLRCCLPKGHTYHHLATFRGRSKTWPARHRQRKG